jgi:RNA polymerase sigma factor (sigma-70 family)
MHEPQDLCEPRRPSESAAGASRAEVEGTIAAVWHIEAARITGMLARLLRDVGRAEEIAQDALVTALEEWPRTGIPERPAAWLMTAARHRAIDELRRRQLMQRSEAELTARASERAPAPDEEIEDDVLRLMFVACHPLLPLEGRVALTLRLIGGLAVPEIARAFLVAETTLQQRIVRAKRTLEAARVPFEVPGPNERTARLAAVLEVVYLIFNEGYAATAGEDWMRPALCEEALRLGRMLAELEPGQAEVHGLVALMELQASRQRARTGPNGEPILLMEQNRARWDRLMIARGSAALARAERLGAPGPYALQAAIAACHAHAERAEDTDWRRIVALYDALAQIDPSPVVALNRAVAVGRAYGAQAALEIVDALRADARLAQYQWLPCVRADLLEQLGRHADAHHEYRRAATLTRNRRERDVLLERMERCERAAHAR